MGARRVKFVLVCLLVIVGAAGLGIVIGRDNSISVKLARANLVGAEKEVVVDFTRKNRTVWFYSAQRVQIRKDGHWEPPVFFRELGPDSLAHTNSERVVLHFPPQTEACRFLLDYRRGPSRYCKVYFFLSRHGIMKRFPKLSQAILQQARKTGIYHAKPELVFST
jgi:hypothetical protein